MGSSKTILSANNLTVGYGKGKNRKVILEDINLQLSAGQLVCFMGPNGVGKSTLIRTLCRAQLPLAGDIVLEHKNITAYPSEAFAHRVSVVYTDKVNAGNMSVEALVSFGRYPYTGWSASLTKTDRKHVEHAMALTNIQDIKNSNIHELSDGQLQKVMIARALCQDTPIIILDEPTAHLDLNNRVEIINLLRHLTRTTNKAILMATHELDLALQSADRIWLTTPQRSIIDGFPEDLVLNGKIDEVFQLKGFDLKTGRLEKQTEDKFVSLHGAGYAYLWTKNALERHGFQIAENRSVNIEIIEQGSHLAWRLSNVEMHEVNTLEELIGLLGQNI